MSRPAATRGPGSNQHADKPANTAAATPPAAAGLQAATGAATTTPFAPADVADTHRFVTLNGRHVVADANDLSQALDTCADVDADGGLAYVPPGENLTQIVDQVRNDLASTGGAADQMGSGPADDLAQLRDDLAADGVSLQAYPARDGTIDVGVITVDKNRRGQGLADDAMGRLCQHADRHQVRVTLTPTAEFGASKTRLEAWYARHGFARNTGRNRDFSTQAGMYRDPQPRS